VQRLSEALSVDVAEADKLKNTKKHQNSWRLGALARGSSN